MDTNNTITISMILSIAGLSFSLTGWIMLCISFVCKISNFAGNTFTLIHPNTFLMTFIGCLLFSLSDTYDKKWASLCIQLLVSALNLSIYIIQKKIYRKRLEDEIR